MIPPNKLKLCLSGKPYEAYLETHGIYTLQNFYANDLPVWKQITGKHAIWYSEPCNHWCVSRCRDFGSETFMIIGPRNIKCYPNNIIECWSYLYDGTLLLDDEENIQFTIESRFDQSI